MDLDTTSTKWSHQRILASVEAGDVDLLLGRRVEQEVFPSIGDWLAVDNALRLASAAQ